MAAPSLKYAEMGHTDGSRDGSTPDRAWTFTEALSVGGAPDDCVCFVKAGDGETATGAIAVGVTGTRGSNTRVVFRAYVSYYNTSYPYDTDMSPGGLYYGSALDAYLIENGFLPANPNATWAVFDGDNLIGDLLTFNGASPDDNITLEGFKLHNVSTAAGTSTLMTAIGSPEGLHFKGCIFMDAGQLGIGSMSTSLFDDCLFKGPVVANGNMITHSLPQSGIRNSVFDIPSGSIGLTARYYGFLYNNIFVGGTYGVTLVDTATLIGNNTFYNQTTGGIKVADSGAYLNEYNNIFNPAAVGDYAVNLTVGDVLYSNYSLAYSLGGPITVQTNKPWWDNMNSLSFAGANSITNQNPNINTWNFKTQVPFYGRPDAGGNRSIIGARLPDLGPAERQRTRHSGYDRAWRL